MNTQLILAVGQRTDPGRVRDHNEDSLATVPMEDLPADTLERKGQLFVVADGMGGHAAGATASRIAAEQVMQAYYASDASDVGDIRQSLERAIRLANAAVFDQSRENPAYAGMGTTLVGIVCQDSRMTIVNVGDSRAYLVRDGGIRQLTEDHSWVAEAVRQGTLPPDQARYHPRRNVITRSLGNRPDVEIDFSQEGLLPGDTLVLCSDGLSGQVYDQEICDAVLALEPQAAAEQLVDLANERGGPDNITVIVVRVVQVTPVQPPAFSELPFVFVGCLGLVIGVLALAFAAFWLLPPLLSPAPTMGPTAIPTNPATQQPAPSAVPPTMAPTLPPVDTQPPSYPPPGTASPTVSAPQTPSVPAYPGASETPPPTPTGTSVPTVTPTFTVLPTFTPTTTVTPTFTTTPTVTLVAPTATLTPTATATVTGTVTAP
ncbi:MAG: Stp1/IreP family PP2C-type Ser/Thr phosphatase [Chloroflexi bacterium]|nr:Stp1/IreP family PP2C-type Ser/Thr phosphatase [Chloroflexota bacterium]